MKGFDHVLGLVWANAIIPSSCTFFRFQEYSVVIMNPFRFVMAIKNSLLRSICFVMQFSIHQEWLLTATFILYYILVFLKRFLNDSRCFSSSLTNVIHYRWNLDLFSPKQCLPWGNVYSVLIKGLKGVDRSQEFGFGSSGEEAHWLVKPWPCQLERANVKSNNKTRELMYEAHKKRRLRANNSEKNNYNSIETATDQYVWELNVTTGISLFESTITAGAGN